MVESAEPATCLLSISRGVGGEGCGVDPSSGLGWGTYKNESRFNACGLDCFIAGHGCSKIAIIQFMSLKAVLMRRRRRERTTTSNRDLKARRMEKSSGGKQKASRKMPEGNAFAEKCHRALKPCAVLLVSSWRVFLLVAD